MSRKLKAVCAQALPMAALICASFAQRPKELIRAAAGGTRGPSALTFSKDGRLAYLAEQDIGQVAILDAQSGKLEGRVSSGGKEPTGLALSADGRTLAVANSFSDSLVLIDTEKRTSDMTIPLPGGPYQVAITPSDRAYVSLSRLDQIAVIDLETGAVVTRIPAGRRPRAIALTRFVNLLCANMTGGDLTASSTPEQTRSLPASPRPRRHAGADLHKARHRSSPRQADTVTPAQLSDLIEFLREP